MRWFSIPSPWWQLYSSRLLSAWGDRIWSFSGGLFVLHIDANKDSLLKVGFYGLSLSLSVTLLGSVLGNWIDKSNRLRAAKTFLSIQNCTVALTCLMLTLYFGQNAIFREILAGFDHLFVTVVVILMASVANLASMGSKVIMEKDWVVVIAQRDSKKLAAINANFRSIDMLTFVLAPVLVGLLLDHVSYAFAAAVVGVWNVASVLVEFALLKHIYHSIPLLRTKKNDKDNNKVTKDDDNGRRESIDNAEKGTNIEMEEENEEKRGNEGSHNESNNQKLNEPAVAIINVITYTNDDNTNNDNNNDISTAINRTNNNPEERSKNRLKSLYMSWHLYMNHRVTLAGLSLSLLYMTVLGFDSITQGYALQQCVSESLLAIMAGISSIFGLAASQIYPLILKRINVTRTGLLGHFLQVSIFALTVISIWMPGSPFLLYDNQNTNEDAPNTSKTDLKIANSSNDHGYLALNDSRSRYGESFGGESECFVSSQYSIWLFLLAITLGRFSLWLCDLSVSQILQEGVEEDIRGTIGTVQQGLNSALDALKFVLVIILPGAKTFGLLILASWLSYVLALALFAIFAKKNWQGIAKIDGETDEKANN